MRFAFTSRWCRILSSSFSRIRLVIRCTRWRLQPVAAVERVKWGGGRLSSLGQEFKQRTDLFTCGRDFIQYARLWKNIFWTTVTRSNKTMLATHTIVYMYSLLCVFISSHNTVIGSMLSVLFTMGEGQTKMGVTAPSFPWSRDCIPGDQGSSPTDP